MNEQIYNNNKKKSDTLACHRVSSWGRHKLVVSEPRFRCFWKSQGLGGFGIEYMIEKHAFSNVLA